MSRPALAGGLLAIAAIVVVAIVVLGGGGNGYHVRLALVDSANGLREGSVVEIGGLDSGTVSSLTTDAHDNVIAELALKPGRGPIGPGASVAIKAKNLLGEKVVALDPGDTRHPEPSGAVIPRSRIQDSVDLDQVLNVLQPETRVRLAALINEAGGSVAGRARDLNSLLQQLPSSFDAGTRLVDDLVSDNRTLGQLVDRSHRFVRTFAVQRQSLGRFLDTVGQTARTAAQRQAQLRQTLADAPPTLARLRRFLADLETTAKPLGPAARAVQASARPLAGTLSSVAPFQRAAQPTLDEAAIVAPQLTKLGREAAPVLRKANPMLQALVTFSRAASPVSRTLDITIDDLFATVQGWDRAIQARDGLSHMFRALFMFNGDALQSQIRRLTADSAARSRGRRHRRPRHPAAAAPPPPRHDAPLSTPVPVPPTRVPTLPNPLPPGTPAPDVPQTASKVLDYLLGH
jgi:virulence factor Mce-like protein